MRCGRSDRVELDAFLLGATGDETVDAFREHYPHCAECAAVVADWMALDGALREVMAEAGLPSPHPEPEDLAAFVQAPARLGEKAMQIESHLATCASCANELVLIRTFDPAAFGAPSEAVGRDDAARAEAGLLESLRETLAGFLERLRGFHLMRPALALATVLLAVAGLWWSGVLGDLGGGRSEPPGPQLVERPEPSAQPGRPAPGPGASGVVAPGPAAEIGRDERSLAARPAAAEKPEAAAVPEVEPVERTPVEVAEVEKKPGAAGGEVAAEPRPSAVPVKRGPSPEPAAAAKPDEILLAAVTELPPPRYATPAGAESVAWMRQFGAVRSAPGTAHVLARAPGDHTGITLSRTPRLWWTLDQQTDLPIQITIVDGEAIEPLVRVVLPGPHAAGLHAFDLAKQGVELSPDVDYRWFVSVVVDPDRPSRNPVSAGSLRVAGPSDARRLTVSSASASARGNKFAELGLWYDAFDFYASLAEAHPEVAQLATYRDRLVEETKITP